MKPQRSIFIITLILICLSICFAQQEQRGDASSEERLYTEDRKRMEKAQIDYYEAQTKKLSEKRLISPELQTAFIALLGTIIGFVVSIVITYINATSQRKLEDKKAVIARRETLDKELRSQVAAVGLGMLSVQHSMEWVCWHAAYGVELVDEKVRTEYQKEIHTIMPKLLGDLAGVASLNRQIYESLDSLTRPIYVLDQKIAEALVKFKNTPGESVEILQQCHRKAVSLHKSLPVDLSKVMKDSQAASLESDQCKL